LAAVISAHGFDLDDIDPVRHIVSKKSLFWIRTGLLIYMACCEQVEQLPENAENEY